MLGFWTCSMSWRTLGPCVATLDDGLELTVSHIVNMRIISDGTMRHSSWYSPNHVGSQYSFLSVVVAALTQAPFSYTATQNSS